VDNGKPFCPICDTAMKKAGADAVPALTSKAEVEVEVMEIEDVDSSPPTEVYDERITKPATRLVVKPEWKGVGGYPGQSKYKKKQPFRRKDQTIKKGRGRPTRAEAAAKGEFDPDWGKYQKKTKKRGRPKAEAEDQGKTNDKSGDQ